MSMVETTVTRANGEAFMGHPRGLFYLAFTEAWERFSYYGMTALLALYMVNQLLLTGHVEQIAGFAGFRAAVESLVGPLSTQALASQIFGLYSGFVYFTPLLGGMIADRWIGQRLGVVIGALSMSAGHIAMTFDRSFLGALLLLVIGSGFLKGNISAQVGALYPREDEARRTRGFIIFSTAINVGAVAGPLLCGLLAQVYGWHYGFGVAAIFMLLGLATYLYGYRYLPAAKVRRHSTYSRGASCRVHPDRRDDHHYIPVHSYVSNLQRESDLDSAACRAKRWQLPDSSPLVPIDQLGFQHPGSTTRILDMASTGIAAARAERTRKDRHWSLDHGCEQPCPGSCDLRFRQLACSPDLAIPL